MIRTLSLLLIAVFSASAFAMEHNVPQREDDTLLCEVVELETEGSEYGIFLDPKTAPAVAQPRINHEINANDGVISPEEQNALINTSFEQSEPASQAPREFKPAPKTRAYETRTPLFYISNPNTKAIFPNPLEAKQDE